MYAYSNHGQSLRAIEPLMELLPDEVVFPDLATEEQLAEAFPGYVPEAKRKARQEALNKIAEAEAKQPRAIREAVLTGNLSRLKALDDEIAALRVLLQ